MAANTNLPTSTGSGDLDNIAVTRAEFRAEIGILLEYLAQALGDVGGDYTSETVKPTEVILQGEPTIEAGANPATGDATQRIPSTKWVKESGTYVSNSAYGTPLDGQLWVDTTASPYVLKAYNNDISDWDLMSGFPSGTIMLFVQEAAPTGWTKQTTNDNMALRVTSGTPTVVNGNQPFTTVFSQQAAAGTVSGHTLTFDEMPRHSHALNDQGHNHGISDPGHSHGYTAAIVTGNTMSGSGDGEAFNQNRRTDISGTGIGIQPSGANIFCLDSGNSQPHSHGFTGTNIDLRINYVDVIICEKD